MVLPSVFLVHTCSIVSRMNQNVKQIGIASVTGTFTIGETITGGTSGATGTVYAVAATYLQYEVVSGTFQTGETIAGTTATATSNTAPTNALLQGIPIVATPVTQAAVKCRFFPQGPTKMNLDSGTRFYTLAKILFPLGTVIHEGDEITGDDEGFIRKYKAKTPVPVYEPTRKVISHWKVEVEVTN